MLQPELAYLLDLRLRLRGNREGMAIVDRCMALLGRAQNADAETLEALYQEAARIGDDLALRFGAPKAAVVQ